MSEQGIDNLVVDSASIEVNRRARRARTDRLDGDKLLVMLRRHHAGGRVWSGLHEPTPEQEDARRTHRELARLTQERTAHMNRIRRDWAAWWERHREQVPPVLRGEIERESARLALVRQQVKALEAARRQELAEGKQPLVSQLAQLRAIGPKGAWVLVKEVSGWRSFANRRELAGCLGLAPTPFYEQEVVKAFHELTYESLAPPSGRRPFVRKRRSGSRAGKAWRSGPLTLRRRDPAELARSAMATIHSEAGHRARETPGSHRLLSAGAWPASSCMRVTPESLSGSMPHLQKSVASATQGVDGHVHFKRVHPSVLRLA